MRNIGILDHANRSVALEEFLEGLPWSVVLIGRAGNIDFLNSNARARQAPQLNLDGQKFSEVYPQYLAVLQGDEPWLVAQEVEYEDNSAAEYVFERLIMSRVGEGGCLIIIDETEIQESEHERIQTSRLASLGFMLAGVCHEVSNPLAATYSMVQLLQSQKEFSEETFRKGLTNIAANVKRILELSRKLNDYSRVGDNRRRRFEVDFAIQEAIYLLRSDAQYQQITIHHNPNPEAVIRGEVGAIQQVFYNIALNAAQAMNGRGELTLSSGITAGSRVSVTIDDTGPGIPPSAMDRVFEPFFTTKRAGAGTGLGLAITWDIVQEHGGTIEVHNKASGGACFTIEFPGERKGI